MEKPVIYNYFSFREFLRDWLEHQKLKSARFSLRKWTKKNELTAAYISMILSGKRTIRPSDTLDKIIFALNLNSREAHFFKLMIQFANQNSQVEKSKILDEMSAFRIFKRMNKKEIVLHQYLSNWENVAIREMYYLNDFKLDAVWIQKKLNKKTTLKRIKDSLRFLIDNGFIKLNSQHEVEPDGDFLDLQSRVYKIALSTFHKQMFEVVVDSIDTVDSKDRNILGQTLSLKRSDFKKVNEILAETYGKIMELHQNSEAGDTVYHVSLSLCPITKVDDDE